MSAITGEPLNKAGIILQHDGPSVDESVSATSDPQGYFSFSDVTPGSYFLRAQRNGFLAAQYGARTTGTLGTVLKVAAGQTIKGIMIGLVPAAVITGRVLDGDGDPLPFARAQLMRYAYYGTHRQLEVLFGAQTNELGEYHIFGVAPGRYFLKASHSGPVNTPGEEYIPVYYPNASDAGVASQMQVSAGSQIRGIDLKLVKARTFRISGRVEHSAANRPMPFFFLTITPRHSDSPVIDEVAAKLDSQGQFVAPSVLPGSYVIRAEYNEGGTRYSARQYVTVRDSSVEGVKLLLVPNFDISVRVGLEGDRGLNMGQLRLYWEGRPGSGRSGEVQVNSDGSATLHGCVMDEYKVRLRGLNGDYYLKSIRLDGQDMPDDGIDLVRIPTGALELIVSSGGGQIDGSVASVTGLPVRLAVVLLVPDGSPSQHMRFYQMASADQSGRFLMQGLVPGEYKLYAFDRIEPNSWMDPGFMKPIEKSGKSVTIQENGRETVELRVITNKEAQ